METEVFDVIPDSNVEVSEKDQICSICGSNHSTSNCTLILITNHVLDKELPTKARLSLPDHLQIETLSDGTNQIRARTNLPKGTRFGPLDAPKTFTLNPSIQFPMKIFPYREQDFLAYYLDTTDERRCSWLMFVQSADTYEEQNMVCYQDESDIYYATTKDVNEKDLLKVWYAPYYAQKMGKPILTMENATNSQSVSVSDINNQVKSQQKTLDRESWTCKFCGSIKTDMADFGKHIIEHYSTQLKKQCEICKSTFATRKSLRNHINVVHNQHLKMGKPALVETPSEVPVNQNTLRELSIGGPLLNNLSFDDNFDNSNLLVPTLEYLDEDLQNLGTENLNVDNLLTENVRGLDHFNFEIGECQEDFVCDICVKSFSKLRYLIQHLKRHTGENMCVSCKKVFCRKESLLNHACMKSASYKCEECDRSFIQKKNYNRHIIYAHNKKFKCDKCDSMYGSQYLLNAHKCNSLNADSPKLPCSFCKKSFTWDHNLKKHMAKHHSTEKCPIFICEICGKEYMSKHAHDVHLRTHEEPTFQCDICDKKFHRKDVYLGHLELHTNQELQCNLCHKKFGSMKNLTLHRICHKEATFKCTTCNSIFRTRAKLQKHRKIHEKSPSLKGVSHSCPYCSKQVKLRSSLSRHIKRIHPDEKNLPTKTNTEEVPIAATSDNDNLMVNTELDLIVSKDNIDSLNEVEMSELNNLQIEMIDNILLNTTKEMGIDDILNFDSQINCDVRNEAETTSIDTLGDREICLSMPDLNDQDLDITLGDKAYILQNGTIVEPQENSDNIVVYVLNQPGSNV